MAAKPPPSDSLVADAWLGDQQDAGIQWVHFRGDFYRYAGGIYVKLPVIAVQRLIREYAEATFGVDRAKFDIIVKAAGVVGQKTSIDEISAGKNPPFWLDGQKETNLLVVNNGVLIFDDLLRGGDVRLVPHTPDLFVITKTDYSYDPAVTCPMIDAFPRRTAGGDEELAQLPVNWVAYAIVKSLQYQKFLILFGKAHTGKSVLLHIMARTVGPGNVTAHSLEQISGRWATENMTGKMLNLAFDLNEILKVEEGWLKSISDGSMIPVEAKYKPYYITKLDIRLVFATNIFPRFTDRTNAIWRRMVIMPCDAEVTEEEKVEQYEDVLTAELPGFLNRVVAAAKRLVAAKHFPVPAASVRAVAAQRREANPAVIFAEECLEVTGAAADTIFSDHIYLLYSRWMHRNGFKGVLGSLQLWHEWARIYAAEIKAGKLVRERGKVVPGTQHRPWEWRGVRYLPTAPYPDDFDPHVVVGAAATFTELVQDLHAAAQDAVLQGGQTGICIVSQAAKEEGERIRRARRRAAAGDAPDGAVLALPGRPEAPPMLQAGGVSSVPAIATAVPVAGTDDEVDEIMAKLTDPGGTA